MHAVIAAAVNPYVLAIVVVPLVVIAALLLLIATRPAEFVVERSATMAAPQDRVHALVNDFHAWQQWSPWENLDPNLHRTYEGPSAGIGAKYAWVGNKNVGEGRMTITESQPGKLIRINLEFLKPFKATNTTLFTFTGHDDHAHVTWRMTGKNNFMGKAFCLVMNMDKMVGGQFEQGLAKMKEVAEAA
jgi:hypothetical protein